MMGQSGGHKHENDDKTHATVTTGIEFCFVINCSHIFRPGTHAANIASHPCLSERWASRALIENTDIGRIMYAWERTGYIILTLTCTLSKSDTNLDSFILTLTRSKLRVHHDLHSPPPSPPLLTTLKLTPTPPPP